MEFEWDINKNNENVRRHHISFDDATTIWNGPVLLIPSFQIHHGEARFVAIGVLKGREISVVYTIREERIRIISARRARAYERKAYRESQKNG